METNTKADIVMEAIREDYQSLRLAYQTDMPLAMAHFFKLLKVTCADYPSILIALSNFETSFQNRGKDKVTSILLKELGQVIKAERRKK